MSNLAKRTVVGVVLGAVIVLSLFIHPTMIFIISLIWIAVATNEFLRMLEVKQIYLSRQLMITINMLIPAIFYFGYLFRAQPTAKSWDILYAVLLFVFFVYALIKREQYYLIVPFGIFTIFYLGFLPSHILFLKIWVREHGFPLWPAGFIAFFPFAFTWVNDTAAYFVGSAIGRHKLAIKISPNKTIEGFVGSVIVSLAFSLFYLRAVFPHISVALSLVMGLILSIGAQVGDLVESGFKRDAGLKDSSQVLPGHGGFLDRVDSLLFTVPIFYYFLIFIISSQSF